MREFPTPEDHEVRTLPDPWITLGDAALSALKHLLPQPKPAPEPQPAGEEDKAA